LIQPLRPASTISAGSIVISERSSRRDVMPQGRPMVWKMPSVVSQPAKAMATVPADA